MLLDIVKQPFFEEDGAGGNGGEVAATQTNTQTADSQNDEQGVKDTGDADQMSFKNDKQNIAFAEMRRKAQEADTLRKKVEELENQSLTAKQLETKLKKLEKALPEGFSSLDEYLESLEGDSADYKDNKPAFDENKVKSMVEQIAEQKLSSNPVVQKAQKYIEQQDKRMENEFIVKNFSELQKRFPEIKKAEDIPFEVLESFMKNEVDGKKYGRSLLSYYVDKNLDTILEKTRKQGETTAIIKDKSTDHTTKVQGTSEATEYDNVEVPDYVREQLNGIGITDRKKQNMYYKRHHRTE